MKLRNGMIIRWKRKLELDGGLYYMPSGLPYSCMEIIVYHNNKYLAFIVTREALSKMLRELVARAIQKLEFHTTVEIS